MPNAGNHVQSIGTNANYNATPFASIAITTTQNVAAGDTVVVTLRWNTALTGLSVAQGANTYNIDVDDYDVNALGVAICSFYYAAGLSSGATITASWTTASTVACITADEFTGFLTASWKDKTAVGTAGAGTTPSSGATATLSQAFEVAVGAVTYYYTGSTPATISGGGFTAMTGANVQAAGTFEEGVLPGYEIVNATTAVTFAPTLSQTATFAKAVVVTYKAGTSGNVTLGSIAMSQSQPAPAVTGAGAVTLSAIAMTLALPAPAATVHVPPPAYRVITPS